MEGNDYDARPKRVRRPTERGAQAGKLTTLSALFYPRLSYRIC